jgi:predicted deacylase
MEELLQVGSLRVEPGERGMEVLQAPVGARTVAVPVIAVHGAREGPRVTITAGIHGAEYVGIEAARRLGLGLDPSEVAGSVVVVPVANTTAFYARAIYTSGLDANNLNRSFPGSPHGAPSEVLADWLFRTVITPSQYYIDLHGGDMVEALVPFVLYHPTEDRQVEAAARKMARATGIPRIIAATTPGSTYAAATEAGIPAILAEIGGQGVWSEELVAQHEESARRVLHRLGVLADEPPRRENARIYRSFVWLRAEAEGLFHPRVRVGQGVEAGRYLGEITDYFGRERQRLEAPQGGEVVFLVTSLAMNRGDPILALAADQEV